MIYIEVSVAATKSFTSQIVTLLLAGIWLSYHKSGKYISYYHFGFIFEKIKCDFSKNISLIIDPKVMV